MAVRPEALHSSKEVAMDVPNALRRIRNFAGRPEIGLLEPKKRVLGARLGASKLAADPVDQGPESITQTRP